MTTQLIQTSLPADKRALENHKHVLFVLPPDLPPDVPMIDILQTRLQRGRIQYTDLRKSALSLDLPSGALSS